MPAVDPAASFNAPVTSLRVPELLAPAGNWDCAKAAVENGADAIYFGLDRFNARMRAENFTEADLPELMAFLHRRGVKGYVTLNTLVFPSELAEAAQYLKTMIAAGVDAVIVQDVGICRLIRHLSPDFPIHGSTQMTVTSVAGVEFAHDLGCQLVVLARECSIKDLTKIQAQMGDRNIALPLEVFVHGALCVAYSGQCLTSEALGGRSANRGECAQACRMPYELIADGERVDLGDRAYLLSPQDLSGLDVLPELVQTGVSCLKIEGRLKAPEYVANVTRVYRQALDRLAGSAFNPSSPSPHLLTPPSSEDRYQLEMAFSRGLHTGWFEGIDNQALVHARFGKKRGVYLGEITRVTEDAVFLNAQAPIKAGDGVVFDDGHPAEKEQGGRIYQVDKVGQETRLMFGRDALNLRRIHPGDKLWKTSDPVLDKELQQTYSGDRPKFTRPITIEVHGAVGQEMVAIARDTQGHIAQAASTMALVEAHSKPLTGDRLEQQLGRLGNTPFYLESLSNHLQGNVMIPVSELNRLRRELVEGLEELRLRPNPWHLNSNTSLSNLLPNGLKLLGDGSSLSPHPHLSTLVRTRAQLAAATEAGIETIYCEFENPATYRDAVQWFRANRAHAEQTVWVAPPRITKPLETYILDQVKRSEADGYLVRNYDHLAYFADQRCVGDFSLNVANALTADYLLNRYGLERVTASYDLNADQLVELLGSAPSQWFEITLHQHMPMFHMEHCVFCAFLSEGKDFRDCGRPCESQQVKLRDRVGTEHLLLADAGCRNTVFNGVAQTGAEYAQRLMQAGAGHFRLEFLDESPEQVESAIAQYRQLLRGDISGSQLWRTLHLQSKLGVTRGPLDSKHSSARG
ncbi:MULTISPECIES: U32 family peptidase [Cyanophyceae]|uniref:U32 family peptidase n=1 Tax=Cyanophyceae TaxID=3028117 RepID=UPI0016834BCB|nr:MULTISPECIES: U32 family peptidase [Cyanophyceae]MBD1915803.1 U32 family peptidase [Phormidium sp. FACHB-77]MBD2030523.1 U32 family peptidase [Phormidium sp. FACHB-322]MBD2053525.1 U32 family peptidase [Leptolyngbya sp. FACHB-60]